MIQSKITIQTQADEFFKNVVDKFLEKTQLIPGSFCILINGQSNPERTVGSLISQSNNESNAIRAIVNLFENEKKN